MHETRAANIETDERRTEGERRNFLNVFHYGREGKEKIEKKYKPPERIAGNKQLTKDASVTE